MDPSLMVLSTAASGGGDSFSASRNLSSSSSSSSLDAAGDDGSDGGGEIIQCLWSQPPCSLTFTDAEALYNHLTNDHVGRKKTNNLCLECHWESCSVVAAKRDHLTSHIRIHIPLKPHSCPICSRAFKRPQDLKKHDRIHLDKGRGDQQNSFSLTGKSHRVIAHPRGASATAPALPMQQPQQGFFAPAMKQDGFLNSPPATSYTGSLSPPNLPNSPSFSEYSDWSQSTAPQVSVPPTPAPPVAHEQLDEKYGGKKRSASDLYDEFLDDAKNKRLNLQYDLTMQRRLDDLSAILGLNGALVSPPISVMDAQIQPPLFRTNAAPQFAGAPGPNLAPAEEIDLDTFLLQLSNEILPDPLYPAWPAGQVGAPAPGAPAPQPPAFVQSMSFPAHLPFTMRADIPTAPSSYIPYVPAQPYQSGPAMYTSPVHGQVFPNPRVANPTEYQIVVLPPQNAPRPERSPREETDVLRGIDRLKLEGKDAGAATAGRAASPGGSPAGEDGESQTITPDQRRAIHKQVVLMLFKHLQHIKATTATADAGERKAAAMTQATA
ncbi:hypothetical protein DFJ73DRAFT_855056 [Zopfochytrium polystomum]|nr:hypothetical protein DFJ73DRAFT_855056 [Zopfochytrium polystomum]